jgi:hypothetical protein
MFLKLALALSLTAGLFLFSAETSYATNSEVGKVTRLQSDARIIRDNTVLPLQIGSAIQKNDEIRSEDMARIEITFTDGTTLLIGENARIEIDEYIYEPNQGFGTALINALQGPFRFITGKIGEMKEKRIEVRSSVGTIGVRGTDFWGGPSQGTYGVFLFEGTIVIFNAEGGRIVSTPGTGVDLDGADIVPGEATAWSTSRAQAAVATVTFK